MTGKMLTKCLTELLERESEVLYELPSIFFFFFKKLCFYYLYIFFDFFLLVKRLGFEILRLRLP